MPPEASAAPFTDSQSARPKLTLVTPTEQPAFIGFTKPNTTPVPDEFFDVLAPTLTDIELRVCLYIIRRTYGFKKSEDAISLQQMVGGIKTRDGEALDRGTGLSRASVIRALKGLEQKGVIHSERQRDAAKGNRPTIYRLRFRGDPWCQPGDPPGVSPDTSLVSPLTPGLSQPGHPQETVDNRTVDNKQGPPTPCEGVAPDESDEWEDPTVVRPNRWALTAPESPPPPEPPAPATPSSEALARAEARILDSGRALDRQSSRKRRDDKNGWSDRPAELATLEAQVWKIWRERNPEKATSRQLKLLARSVAPDEAEAFKQKTRAYVNSVDDATYLKSLGTWLADWRDWEPRRIEPRTAGERTDAWVKQLARLPIKEEA